MSQQRLNTILAALCFYQENGMGEPANRSDAIHDIATNGDTDISLDDAGIDELCSMLNNGELMLVEDGDDIEPDSSHAVSAPYPQ